MKVVQFHGGPCTGKTTGAWRIAALCSQAGMTVHVPDEPALLATLRGEDVTTMRESQFVQELDRRLHQCEKAGYDLVIIDQSPLSLAAYADAKGNQDDAKDARALDRSMRQRYDVDDYMTVLSCAPEWSNTGRPRDAVWREGMHRRIEAIVRDGQRPVRPYYSELRDEVLMEWQAEGEV